MRLPRIIFHFKNFLKFVPQTLHLLHPPPWFKEFFSASGTVRISSSRAIQWCLKRRFSLIFNATTYVNSFSYSSTLLISQFFFSFRNPRANWVLLESARQGLSADVQSVEIREDSLEVSTSIRRIFLAICPIRTPPPILLVKSLILTETHVMFVKLSRTLQTFARHQDFSGQCDPYRINQTKLHGMPPSLLLIPSILNLVKDILPELECRFNQSIEELSTLGVHYALRLWIQITHWKCQLKFPQYSAFSTKC